MKRSLLLNIVIALGAAACSGCSPRVSDIVLAEPIMPANIGTPVKALPSHIIYKMSGDYANLVPVTIDQDGKLISFPDPIDIRESQKPVPLGNGWYLDRRGVGKNTAFTSYTYEEYHGLASAPSPAEIMEHIVARNAITEIWNCGQAQRTINDYRKLAEEGFPGCEKIK